ncbi:hypothetical protein KTT66_07400 [Lacticaseibacillus casei]|uniref:Uncharacterized protein n=1 Tax=Lacticaseibacillus huelsenbergensis TaxID=3035291 RepID=A0ABY8DU10_9LACO|nr:MULTISPECIES: hypothetical protein [Lacticaseibacillus]MDG3062229.1 hypothetical protein [Lacticaseibacillus sp. BCRC 81376]QVI36236.1 hypothetical protein KGS74_08165 [Lacticaseibacillus casei]QXG58033.1 hypothetical protein KTT66_07400 [Lacticaseibacillus casei]WFB40494.1 hypothetical protein LHUE1_001288 [Lacticaseibacillus huelsenbergensis]WFB42244.1 hypothetical protein LHUE2_000211 [Lacticaseibacillus huelsenbergensis]
MLNKKAVKKYMYFSVLGIGIWLIKSEPYDMTKIALAINMGYILFFAGSLLSVPSFFLISSFLLIYGNSSFENHFNRRIVQNSIRLFEVTIIIVACLVFVILGSLNNSVWLIPLAFLCINAILVGTSKQQK